MGSHLFLHIDPARIQPKQWERTYDDILRLLQSHPSQLSGIAERNILNTKLAVYVRQLEHRIDDPYERHWHVVGDFQSKRHAESFIMYRNLARYCGSRALPARDGGMDSRLSEPVPIPMDDILLGERVVEVFGSKTQGEPYRIPLLAVAMAIENRFPHAAMVSGNISRRDAEAACALAEEVLGEPIALPVRMDGPALWARLLLLDGCGALDHDQPILEVFHELFCGEKHEKCIAVLSCASNHQREEHLLALLLREDTGPSASTAPSYDVLLAWLEVTGDLETLFALACMDDRGPGYAPDNVVCALAGMWHAISDDEDDKIDTGTIIERAPPKSVPGLLAALLASRYARGLSPHMRMSAAMVEAALGRVFSPASARLVELLRVEIARHRASMSELGAMIVRAANLPQDSSLPALQEMVAIASPDDLSPWQRQHIEHLASGVYRLFGKHPEIANSAAEVARCRQQIVRGLVNRRPVLTEDAWAWIAEEDDPAVLQTLLALALMQAPPEPVYSVRRAVLENRALCLLLAELTRDLSMMPGSARIAARNI